MDSFEMEALAAGAKLPGGAASATAAHRSVASPQTSSSASSATTSPGRLPYPPWGARAMHQLLPSPPPTFNLQGQAGWLDDGSEATEGHEGSSGWRPMDVGAGPVGPSYLHAGAPADEPPASLSALLGAIQKAAAMQQHQQHQQQQQQQQQQHQPGPGMSQLPVDGPGQFPPPDACTEDPFPLPLPMIDPATLTPEQRVQLKKEKARVYSMRARRRQEHYVGELRTSVDVLMVYRYLVEDCGPDLVLCLSPGAESVVLYANSLALRALGAAAAEGSDAAAMAPPMAESIIGRPVWEFVHTEDAPRLLLALRTLLLKPVAAPIQHLRCRLLSPRQQPEGHISVHAALRTGPQGVVCALRPEDPSAVFGVLGFGSEAAAGGAAGAGAVPVSSPLSGWWDASALPPPASAVLFGGAI